MSDKRRACLLGTALTILMTVLGTAAFAADEDAVEAAQKRSPLKTDFLAAAYLADHDRIVVAGAHGLIGMLEVGDEAAQLSVVTDPPDEDFTALAKLNDGEALIGSSTGRLYHYDGETVTELAALSEYSEPILAIAVGDAGVWVGGGRGLLARSDDGEQFEVLDIRDSTVRQPLATFPGGQAADWYMGVGNMVADSIKFTAFRNGAPAKDPEDYEIHTDDGIVEVANALDMNPAPTIEFNFHPGPAYRGGDVSWNAITMEGNTVTIMGEFGMILQTEDKGANWIRRDIEMVPQEPEPPYWTAATQEDNVIWVTGAAGVSQVSNDSGATWTDNPSSGLEGIFGVTLRDDGTPVVAGAVGLIGTYGNDGWSFADRTRLRLLSWMRNPIIMPDKSVVVAGGRVTLIRLRDGEYTRIPVNF